MDLFTNSLGVIKMKLQFRDNNNFSFNKNIQNKGNEMINQLLNRKSEAIESSQKKQITSQIRNMDKTDNKEENDDKMISYFFNSTISNFEFAERALERGAKASEILADAGSTEEQKLYARNEIETTKKIVNLMGGINAVILENCNSATSGKLMETIGQISDKFIQNGILDKAFSVDSIVNFSSGSLNIDNVSFENPKAMYDTFKSALDTLKNNRKILNSIYSSFKEEHLKKYGADFDTNINELDIII
jgi:hypothetical protein